MERRSGRTDIRLHDLRWISLYRINVRMVDRFRVHRVFLAGDAAHVHSSAAGQGLNTSVQDAYNLGWKLAAVVSGAPAELLDTYAAERLPVAAHVLGISSAAHRANFRTPTGPAPAIHQLDVNYRDGPLATDDRPEPGRLRAGDRAPDGILHDRTRVFEALRGTHYTLLAFGDVADRDLRDLGDEVRVRRAVESDAYDIEDGNYVLVRPDGYIGVITHSVARIARYLDRVQGERKR
jgi:hypothetical protein